MTIGKYIGLLIAVVHSVSAGTPNTTFASINPYTPLLALAVLGFASTKWIKRSGSEQLNS